MSIHAAILDHVARHFGARLQSPPHLTQDALTLTLDNGVVLTVRYAATDAYSLRWHGADGDAGVEPGIDTAPTHPELASRPNHLHLADGRVVADPLTRPDANPEDNVAAVIEALLRDPQLQALQT